MTTWNPPAELVRNARELVEQNLGAALQSLRVVYRVVEEGERAAIAEEASLLKGVVTAKLQRGAISSKRLLWLSFRR